MPPIASFERLLRYLPLLIVPFCGQPVTLIAQTVVNGDLEGEITGSSSLPFGWQVVPFDDPACGATNWPGATPDLTSAQDPAYWNGVMGNPYSGSTFISGLHYYTTHHEGIMQQVHGFEIGCVYEVGFYQTVVKQDPAACLDPSGSWAVWVDNSLIGISEATYSAEPIISLNMPWERRVMTFVAEDVAHWIKFLPTDDDDDQTSPDALRMGIDSIWVRLLEADCTVPGNEQLVLLEMPNVFTPNGSGNNDLFIPIDQIGVHITSTSILDRWGREIHQSSGGEVRWDGKSMNGEQVSEGTYFWIACGRTLTGEFVTFRGAVLLLR